MINFIKNLPKTKYFWHFYDAFFLIYNLFFSYHFSNSGNLIFAAVHFIFALIMATILIFRIINP